MIPGARLLAAIRDSDPSADGTSDAPDAEERYRRRDRLINCLIALAPSLCWNAGYGVDTVELPPGTPPRPVPVAYVDLPTGQCSWHLAPYGHPWDGHTTPQKYDRVTAYIGDAPTTAGDLTVFTPQQITAAVEAACRVAWPMGDESAPEITDRDDLAKVIDAAITALVDAAADHEYGIRCDAPVVPTEDTVVLPKLSQADAVAEVERLRRSDEELETWTAVERRVLTVHSDWKPIRGS